LKKNPLRGEGRAWSIILSKKGVHPRAFWGRSQLCRLEKKEKSSSDKKHRGVTCEQHGTTPGEKGESQTGGRNEAAFQKKCVKGKVRAKNSGAGGGMNFLPSLKEQRIGRGGKARGGGGPGVHQAARDRFKRPGEKRFPWSIHIIGG